MHAAVLLLAAGVAAPGAPPVVRGFEDVVVTAEAPPAPPPALGQDLRKGLLVAPERSGAAAARPGPKCAVRVVPADPDVDRGIHRPAGDVVDPAMAVRGRCVP
jgi:hypothetical protein